MVLRGDEREILRSPQAAALDSTARKEQILPGNANFKSPKPLSSALELQCIIDTGCEALAVIGYELVPKLVCSNAKSPIRPIGAGSNSLKGGTHCICGALLLPIFHKGGYVRARCPDAILYIADIRPRAIVGYSLLAKYGLAVVPGQGTLIFEEDLGEEVMPSPSLFEPPPGLELTQVAKDNPIQAVVPLYCMQDPSITEDSQSGEHRDEGSTISVGVGTGRLNAPVESPTRPWVSRSSPRNTTSRRTAFLSPHKQSTFKQGCCGRPVSGTTPRRLRSRLYFFLSADLAAFFGTGCGSGCSL